MLASVVDYVREHPEELLTLVRQHLELTLVSVVVAAVIAWPAATAATRMPRLARLLTGVASVTQTVPSIAVLGLVIPVLGIGFAPALFALVLRALMPLFLNTYVGLKTVDPAMLEAARGLGMRSWQVLLYVEGPTVLPAALAGLRTAAVQNVAIAGPITYTIDGEQYIAVNAGWGGGLAHFERASGHGMNVSSARLLVFKLGGTAQLPPLPEAPPLEEPPMSFAPESVIQAGAALYAQHCALCHGAQARGGIRDLRYMTGASHREFADILLRGTRASAGMASFADLLSPQDVAAIHAYVIARAHEDWGMLR